MIPIPLISLLLVLCARSSLQADQIPESCDHIILHRELGCTPIFETGKKCPVAYNCDDYKKLDPSVCYYNGKVYKKNDTLEKAEACHSHCTCQDAYPNTEHADWRCAVEDCSQDEEFKLGCVKRYNSLKDCCQNSTYCEGKDPKPAVTCSYQGKNYVEGEVIEDDKTCRSCICKEGVPTCEPVSCKITLNHMQDLRDGCVPVYYGEAHCSCPIQQKCPESTDVVLQKTQGLMPTIQGRTCKFGDLTLKVGEKLKRKDGELFECGCETPPFITCIQPREKSSS